MVARDLGRWAGFLDNRRAWNGPAHDGPGGIFAVAKGSSDSLPWTVYRLIPESREVRPVLPFATFELAIRAAEAYAAG